MFSGAWDLQVFGVSENEIVTRCNNRLCFVYGYNIEAKNKGVLRESGRKVKHNSKNDRATLGNQSGESAGDRTRDQVANQKSQYPMSGFGADGNSTILKVAHIGLAVMCMNIYTYKYK